MSEKITVRCPICKIMLIWSPSARYRPFCSERCYLRDLGAWASETYIMSDECTPSAESNEKDCTS